MIDNKTYKRIKTAEDPADDLIDLASFYTEKYNQENENNHHSSQTDESLFYLNTSTELENFTKKLSQNEDSMYYINNILNEMKNDPSFNDIMSQAEINHNDLNNIQIHVDYQETDSQFNSKRVIKNSQATIESQHENFENQEENIDNHPPTDSFIEDIMSPHDDNYLSCSFSFDEDEIDCGNTVSTYTGNYDEDLIQFNTEEEARKHCLENTRKIINMYLPLKIYYKKLKKKEYKHVANMTYFEINTKQNGFVYNIELTDDTIPKSTNNEKLSITSSLTTLVQYLRKLETNKDIKLNGWIVLKYSDRKGKYRSLGDLLTKNSRKGLSPITRKTKFEWNESLKKYIIPPIEESIFPEDDLPL